MSTNLTLDMIYHPDLAKTWHFYQYIIFIFTTFANILTCYVVLKKSTHEMGVYRLMLINQLFWSYLFDLSLVVWQPVVLLPFFMCYSTGLAQFFGPLGVFPMFIITFFSYSAMIQSIIIAFFYRISRLYSTGTWLIENKKTWIKIGIVLLVGLELLTLAPVMTWLCTPNINTNIVRTNVISSEPIMAQVIALEPTSNGIDWVNGRHIMVVGFFTYGIIIFGFIFTLIFSTILFFVQGENQKTENFEKNINWSE